MSDEFCQNNCGLKLDVWLWGDTWVRKCPKHGSDYKSKEQKELRGKYSGKSKTPYGDKYYLDNS